MKRCQRGQESMWSKSLCRLYVVWLIVAVACLVVTLRAGSDRAPVAVARTVPVTVIPRAVLYPDSTARELFFVARGDGSHIFSHTLREHLAAVRRVRAAQGR